MGNQMMQIDMMNQIEGGGNFNEAMNSFIKED